MVNQKMIQKDVIDELSKRTGFYKKNIKELLVELDNIIIENINR